jgi:Uma2 family endonuclease
MTMISTVMTEAEAEKRLLLPGEYTWQAFEQLKTILVIDGSFRITFLDGQIELMTTSETHEYIKSMLGMLIEAYLIASEIEFMPVGQATRADENKRASFEPDESYYLGDQKEHPDLAIEVVLTSGNLQKLEKYRRFGIQEVWFWENNQLQVFWLTEGVYTEVPTSQLLPRLDLKLLVQCVQMESRLEAMKLWRKGF